MMYSPKETEVITGVVRFAYTNLIRARSYGMNRRKKYGTVILLPKEDVQSKMKIDAAVFAAIQKGLSGSWNGEAPPQMRNVLRDGDEPSHDGKPPQSFFQNHFVISARNQYRPEVVDIDLMPVEDDCDVYGGMYGHALLDFYPFVNGETGDKGVSCNILAALKTADGQYLHVRPRAREAFFELVLSHYPTTRCKEIQAMEALRTPYQAPDRDAYGQYYRPSPP